ncbi:hypothetical protein Pcinc_024732 [Petrolisthes cinctipes]|uniref:Secreted protein n=1 Tax=Petrolisthes cinctipes TaxID=88211 RepID=A0AAE1FC15_PETCI|nr:hypothetical protein Pcinc_024732 [Petrolisthes cinctipes]
MASHHPRLLYHLVCLVIRVTGDDWCLGDCPATLASCVNATIGQDVFMSVVTQHYSESTLLLHHKMMGAMSRQIRKPPKN